MKRIIYIMLSFLSLNTNASENSIDSYTIQRLIIITPNGEVLLEQNAFA